VQPQDASPRDVVRNVLLADGYTEAITEIDFSGLLTVMAVAFSAPLVLALAPALRLPAVVLEIVAGIALGPGGFGWVEVDDPIRVLSLIGLAFLLFLAGLEIELDELRIPFGEAQPSPAEIAHQNDAQGRGLSSARPAAYEAPSAPSRRHPSGYSLRGGPSPPRRKFHTSVTRSGAGWLWLLAA
jgi:hypothetical protein